MLDLRKMNPEEVKYCYKNSHEISMKTGLIGHVRADFGSSGNEFWSTWWDFDETMNTPEFKAELKTVIDWLREDGCFLSSRDCLEAFCDSGNALPFDTGRDYGERVESDKYAFLMRINPYKGEYNMYCYCYIKEHLDDHIELAKRGISIRNKPFEELCRLDDGDEFILEGETLSDVKDSPTRHTCRYIDDAHFESGSNIYHVDQFGGIAERNGYTVIPLRASLPERCYVFIETSKYIGIVKKGEKGYYRTDITASTYEERKVLVAELNEKLRVTPAQTEAMKFGSMFGWHSSLADPKSYDEEGRIIVKRKGELK